MDGVLLIVSEPEQTLEEREAILIERFEELISGDLAKGACVRLPRLRGLLSNDNVAR
jgi:hypothetical protein